MYKKFFSVISGLMLCFVMFTPVDTVNQVISPSQDQSVLRKLFGSQQQIAPYVPPILAPGQHQVAVLSLEQHVEREMAASFISMLKQVNKANAEFVVVKINTPGGSTTAGFAIAQAIEESNAPVICVVDEDAESMGFYILQSCTVRYMTKRSKLMAHEPKISGAEINGHKSDLFNLYESMNALTECLIEQYVHRSNVSSAEMRERILHGKEWWFNWEEAVKRHMVDGVVPNAITVTKMLIEGKYSIH